MATSEPKDTYTSFLGTGWSFPPTFVSGGVRMVADADDVEQSLRILFGTTIGERLFAPTYGLDVHGLLFEPMSTTMRSFLAEQIRVAILIYEPRIDVLSLLVDSPDPNGGTLVISLEYEIRATSSRYNLVYPFYTSEGSEALSFLTPRSP